MEALIDRLNSASNSKELMNALYGAIDYMHCSSIEVKIAHTLCKIALNRVEEFEDREEALYFVSTCASRIETICELDLSPLVSLIPSGSFDELISILNVLANSCDRSHLKVIESLTNHRNIEVAEAARMAITELTHRS